MGQNIMLNYTGQIKISYAPKLKEAVTNAQQSPLWLWQKSNGFCFGAVLCQYRAVGGMLITCRDDKGSAIAQTPTRPLSFHVPKTTKEGETK